MADKSKKQQYLDAIKTMTPGAVLEFVSQQLNIDPAKFLAKNAGWLALAAAKNGWVKASEIKDAVKNFGNKNKEDNTGIDFENAEVDEDTMKFMCLLDSDTMKKLDEFVKNYYDSIKDIGKEMKDADDKLEKDAKSKKIDLKPDEIKANGLEVAKVIDSKNNKGKSGKELTDEIKEQIDRKKQEEELEQKKKEMAKLLANVDKDELDKIIKAVYKNNKPKKESIQHRKRGKLILAEAASAGAGDSAMEKLMADVKINGKKLQNFNSSGIYHQACKSLGVDDKDMARIFSRSSSSNSINFAKNKIMQNMQAFVVNYEKDPDKAIQTAMVGLKGNQKDALAEILCKMKPEAAEKFKDIGIDVNGKLDDIADADTTDAADVTTKTISKSAMADIGFTEGKAPGDDFVKCPFPVDREGNGFIASNMTKRLNNLEDIFDDGKMDAAEYKEYMTLQTQMIEYNTWAMAHADSTDPNIQAKVKQIFELNKKLNQFELDNYEELDDAVNERVGAVKGAKPNMAASDETKEELKKKTGMKMFTGLGWARLAARTTGYVLNHGKDLVNALGAKAIKKKEDNGVIAEITVLLTNGEGSDTKFSDTKFSVRFNVTDMKWHATNLDDRKMKFPEDIVIKKILDTNTGKKFKATCLKKWSNVFDPKDKSKKIVADILSNPKKNGMKLDGDTEKFIDMVSKIGSNFDSIKKQFS